MRPDWYPYVPITERPPLAWPNGARLAVIITINVETWELERGLYQGGPDILPFPLPNGAADIPNYGWREYGHRVGFWRLAEVLDALGIRASCTLNGLVPERMPQLAAAIRDRGWEYVAHCVSQAMLPSHQPDRETERAMVLETIERLTRTMGTRPRGWLSTALASSHHTVEILAEAGLDFYCDLSNDDQPYLMNVAGRTLVSVPYTIEYNDYSIYVRGGGPPNRLQEVMLPAFDTLYAEGATSGRLLNLGLHPHVQGQPHRIAALRETLGYFKSFPGVWFPSRAEITDFMLRQQR